ncbi:type II toxin-antitoxin system Phd/YefM family antitoxin [Paraeggerthella hongkongensis]|uniref:type II toxin-antitoxin system Phd/YefM family antitoxin n=1 Tax=Paraeggerthella TaxID=651554 RepID=UPI000DF7EE2C|nr:type II toxin-antitoxin system Phd/YefM family antitoxin [Paraeggerthella hongkongensis]
MTTMTVSSSEFRRNMPNIVGKAEESGATIVVIKNSRPWFEIRPLARSHDEVPTEETLEALRDLEVMRKDPNAPVYRDVSQFFADLGI